MSDTLQVSKEEACCLKLFGFSFIFSSLYIRNGNIDIHTQVTGSQISPESGH